MAFLREFNIYTVLIRIAAAAVLGGLIGLERGRHGRAAGMRTHIFVCLGASLCAAVGLYTINILGNDCDPLRIGAQVVSGIGFLGAGTILIRGNNHIMGLTTAAGLWATAAIGLAVGVGFYEAAILCTVICIFTAAILSHFEADKRADKHTCALYIEASSVSGINEIIEMLKKMGLSDIEITAPKSEIQGNVGITSLLSFSDEKEIADTIKNISEHEYVAYAYQTN